MMYSGAYTQEMYDLEARTCKNIEDFLDASCFPDCGDYNDDCDEDEDDYFDEYD